MLSASVGIVLGSADVDSAGRLMQLSGLARLRAASTGAPYEIYDPAMQEQARARLARETELRRAVQHNQFSLYYQPIVSLETGRIVETEALLRWRHPQRGVVNAGEFIGLAEEMGLTVPLGWFALDAAVHQLQAWSNAIPANGSLPISINMTAAHFRQPNVPERIGELLRKAGVTRGVNLEVTESLLINDATRAAETLAQLRQLGIGIHLDDFGTGYSSLQYLHELPFDAIKIDRSFIARLSKGGRDSQIVATIRELARQLGIPVIAEGVETQEHLTLVRALGCEFAQGYFFARPMPPEDLANLVSKNPAW